MSGLGRAIAVAERMPLPDAVVRLGIEAMVSRTRRQFRDVGEDITSRFAADMDNWPVATHVQDANVQHYEVPAAYFDLVLGPQRKYSCCLYPSETASLAEAEEFALEQTAAHAGLADGQDILELGCGWGSLSLWMARRYRNARIVAVSNSHSQRQAITTRAELEGLSNLRVVTADMNAFDIGSAFDRIVSVEMFEHMANWRLLLARSRGWLRPDGRMFVHVFAHRVAPYRFDRDNKADWIAQHFFTGGLMPSRALMHQFADLFAVETEWWWDGRHYARTAEDWLRRHDANTDSVLRIFAPVYGADAKLWHRRWRYFFLATAGLFGHRDGREWGVAHYLLRPA